ncbi:NADP-dependent 3-hydroxy acid dehydrogenase YdfG [Pedobacter westerhofensis]|uniref:NADP-dependent 3-hydroxy acid dehydrogenase YdfG n=1 Tax=Pedobacter westerhofensis TaxID=425512 RepID=A0A521CYZ3_9SPHI|nr:SDR family NAD(P)-dependent oxidoreductase [Pedobacter westerhofensis]SMO64638.1 NADP-dependent 3-hydroxy acid dehydrogenase YdfG [Pedobacter westerhofensis]
METKSQVWYVTGATEGLGLDLVKQLLAAGYKVAATGRNAEDLEAAVGHWYPNFLPLEVNLSNEDSVSTSLKATATRFGKIDVVVNNTDSPISEDSGQMSDKEARATFEINVFGMMNVIRNAMPNLRKNLSGHFFNVSSSGEFNGTYPGFSIYCAARFAVAGLSESLAAEARPFNIGVTVVLPGQFHTGNLNAVTESKPSSGHMLNAQTQVEHKQELYPDGAAIKQQVDPKKAAALMISIAAKSQPPLYLFLGKRAFEDAAEKINLVQKDMCAWKSEALSTDAKAELE